MSPVTATAALAAAPAQSWQGAAARDTRPARTPIAAAVVVGFIDVLLVRMAMLMAGLAPEIARQHATVIDPLAVAAFTIHDLMFLVGIGTATVVVFKASGLYDAKTVRPPRAELYRVVGATVILTGFGLLLFLAVGGAMPRRQDLFQFWSAATALLVVERSVRCRLARARCRRVVIVGSGARAL